MTDADYSINRSHIKAFLRSAQSVVGIRSEVNFLITSNQEMCRLNRHFRGKNRPTDVLSFPAAKHEKIAGDIAISGEIARKNAEALGHPFTTEVKILLLHGLLHLAGYDHETDRGEMAALEQKLRARLNLPTGLIERTTISQRGRRGSGRKPLTSPLTKS